MSALLEIRSLTVTYGGEGNAIARITMSVDHREILGIVGESGCGKTTLVRTILNLLSPNAEIVSGEILFCNKNLRAYSREEWRQLRGNEIAMIFQNPGSHLNPILRIGRQFVESIRNHRDISKADAVKKVRDTLRKVHLRDVDRIIHSYPFQLSGGMKQRVAIAMALAMEPRLILADEPTSALDVMTQVQIINELMELREQFDTSIILVTHNIGCAAYMSDTIMVMNEGEIVEYDRKARVITAPEKAYTKKLLAAVPQLKGLQA
ncbi:peptide ABC transporter ATP-binding protein [candidate division KSB3 bacterium]|uniref:Peptide ABC transporter ATP-binding protein n=1 Tax=candidate division KSB3 bacterium TaxID=2044937 RepID=A0A2G6K7E1_9BACT|nr:MAG: peptide ABC transporter ATP-binding protein [candidate division KSB3 bacterium]